MMNINNSGHDASMLPNMVDYFKIIKLDFYLVNFND